MLHGHRKTALRVALTLAAIALVVGLVARVDFRRDLHRIRIGVLSGAAEGNYHAIVARLAADAAVQRGVVTNVATEGSVDNVKRLRAASSSCEVEFAFVQEGTDWQGRNGLQVIGRLPHPESVLLVGKKAEQIVNVSDLSGLRVGVGPAGGGTARVASQLFGEGGIPGLSVRLSNHGMDEQVALAATGELDLAMMVIDADAPLVVSAVRDKGLGVVGLRHPESVARKWPYLRVGRIPAGEYDAMRVLPPDDRAVLQVDTLIVGNGCAGRSRTIGLLSLLSYAFPDFVRHNRASPNTSGLPVAPAARDYLENGGPEALDEYAPWLGDVMPPGNWAYVVMGVSLLFNAMGAGHRFRLWRIDASRVKAEEDLHHVFPPGTTLGDIERMTPEGALLRPEVRAGVAAVVAELEALASVSRKQSLSMLVPMGQEMAYRYQEGVILKTIATLRAFVRRCEEAERGTASSLRAP